MLLSLFGGGWKRRIFVQRYGLQTFLGIILFLFLTGFSDHFFEKPFSKFRWPPYTNVREQVMLELNDHAADRLYINPWEYYDARILPPCDEISKDDNFLLIVVKSAVENFGKRIAIRKTWGATTSCSQFKIRIVFIIGEALQFTEPLLSRTLGEISMYKDVIVGNFYDNYLNNTLKYLMAIKYSSNYCEVNYVVPYALFVDDDYIIIMDNLIATLEKHDLKERLYMGWRFDTQPFRFKFHKHRVSLSAYPFDRYPPYISGGAILYSRNALRELYLAIQHTALFPFDDIYAGILAHLLGITATHNKEMRFWETSITNDDAKTLICAHGFGGDNLIKQYNLLRRSIGCT